MTESDPSRFRMRLDDENEETLAQKGEGAEVADRRIKGLAQRVNRIALLLPILVVLILVFGYLDLEKRVTRSHDTGSDKVQSLSENLEERFSSLSVKQAKLEEEHQQAASRSQTLADGLRKDVEALQVRVTDAVERIDKTQSEIVQLSTGLKAMVQRLDPVIKEQKAAADRLGALDDKYTRELVQFNGSLGDLNEMLADLTQQLERKQGRIDRLESGIERLSGGNLSRADLTAALDEEKKIYREMLRLISRNLEERLEAMEEQIRHLKAQTQAPVSARPFPEPPDLPETTPEPGTIMEKSLP